MIRMRDIRDAGAAATYFGKADGGYYIDGSGLHREVGGHGARHLRLDSVDYVQFKRLLQGLDPQSGNQLSARLLDKRLAGWDVTASVPKGVTIALERGDQRIHDALWEAGRETMADLERLATTRMKGGRDGEKITGNLIWYGFEHPETRPSRADGMPDPDRHIHFVIPNLTWDADEQQWKAIRFRPIMDLPKWFDRRFDMRLASKLADLGYGIETKYKSDGIGGKRFFSWDIKDMPQSVVNKFSRRTAEVDATEKAALAAIKARDPDGPDKLSPVARDKLGATSRLHKRDDMTLDDYRQYWNSRITEEEGQQVAEVIKAAMLGQNLRQENTVDKGVSYAIAHQFERNSVVKQSDLEITAMERCMGGATPEDIEPEMRKQGVLTRDGEATTKEVLAEEGRIIAFVREGRGTMRPLALQSTGGLTLNERSKQADPATFPGFGQQKGRPEESRRPSLGLPQPAAKGEGLNPATLSHEQQAVSADHFRQSTKLVDLSSDQQVVARHVWDSEDRLILIRGAAGTGKTTTTKAILAGIDQSYAMLAPTAEASRGVLRREGFEGADTVAAFLGNRDWQQRIRDGVIFVDEAGLLPIRDLGQIVTVAKEQNARIVLMGDPKQHKSVARHGNMFHVLQEYAGLPVAELRDIKRQRGQYKEAIAAIDKGEYLKAHDIFTELGYVREVEGNVPIVEDYLAAQEAGKSVLIVAPTHIEGDEITGEIRARLKKEGKLGEEILVERLVPLGWSDAEKSDPLRYDGTETIQFFRNSGPFRAGERVGAGVLLSQLGRVQPGHFAVYHHDALALAAGDRIRITGNGWDTVFHKGKPERGKHKLNNGAQYTVDMVDGDGNVTLNNGWILGRDFGHLDHGYVSTSFGSQGKTVDVVLGAMGAKSYPAINAEQFYVTASRGRQRFTLYTNLPPAEIRHAIQRQDTRKSATELMRPRRRGRERLNWLVKRSRDIYRRLHERPEQSMADRERGYGYGR